VVRAWKIEMGLFDFIKGKKGGSKEPADQLALLGADESRDAEFVDLLSKSSIWLLGDEQELKVENPTEAEFLGHIKQGMEETASATALENIKFYTYPLDQHTVLPLFSSQDFIGTFIENGKFQRVTSFQGLQLHSSILLREDLLKLPAVMNPNSKFTRLITAENKIALAKALSAQQK